MELLRAAEVETPEQKVERYERTLRAIAACDLTGVDFGDWVQAVVEDALAGLWPECHKCGTAVHDGPCVGDGDDAVQPQNVASTETSSTADRAFPFKKKGGSQSC